MNAFDRYGQLEAYLTKSKESQCEYCQGTGETELDSRCPNCLGTGRMMKFDDEQDDFE